MAEILKYLKMFVRYYSLQYPVTFLLERLDLVLSYIQMNYLDVNKTLKQLQRSLCVAGIKRFGNILLYTFGQFR